MVLYVFFSFDADPVIAPIVVLVWIKGLQMMPMHENIELSFISFLSGSQSPKLVDGDGTSKFLLPLLALSSSSSEDDLFIGPRNISSADMDSCPSMDNYHDTCCILIMKDKDLVVEQNHVNSDANGYPSWMELSNEHVNRMLMPLVIRMMTHKVK